MGTGPSTQFQEFIDSVVLVRPDAWHERLPLNMNVQVSWLLRFFNSKHRYALLVRKINPILVFVWIAYWTWTLVILRCRASFAHVTLEVGDRCRSVVRCYFGFGIIVVSAGCLHTQVFNFTSQTFFSRFLLHVNAFYFIFVDLVIRVLCRSHFLLFFLLNSIQ
jgi:hypothetical protein